MLLVDDNDLNIRSTTRILEGLDINIKAATSGEEALKAIIKEEFFLILMDVQMPGMDGFETVSILRENENYKNIPVIFLTAFRKEEKHVYFGYESGAVDYLVKPINEDILKSKIRVFLELHEQKKHLQDALEKLEAKNRELMVYDQIVAHDLVSPLASIITIVELIKEYMGEGLEERVLMCLNGLTESAYKANNLIRNVLDFAIADKPEELKREIGIKECIDNAVSNLETIIQDQNVSIIIESLSLSVDCVPVKIQQLFQNLISNSIKYQLPGNFAEIKVYSESYEDEGIVEIIVADNGIGFPQYKANEIFSPFKRLATTEKYEGSGIGLATCKKIVDFHGWRIRAESEEGKGARFIVSIPGIYGGGSK